MTNIKEWLKVVGLIWGMGWLITCTVSLMYFVMTAYLNGSWLVWLDFNHYGEGAIEFVGIWTGAIIAFIMLPEIFRRWVNYKS